LSSPPTEARDTAWVTTHKLVEAMATFDSTQAVHRNRGYLIVEGADDTTTDEEFSQSIMLMPRK
jgi:hypothetical protein